MNERTYRKKWPDLPYLSKSDLQEMLLARMAGGDLYAMEEWQKWRSADMMLDRLRIRPIYASHQTNSNDSESDICKRNK